MRNRTERLSELIDWKTLETVSSSIHVYSVFSFITYSISISAYVLTVQNLKRILCFLSSKFCTNILTILQFYREARRKALEVTHPNFKQVIEETVKKLSRPTSALSTPLTSRTVSPVNSDESDTTEQEEFEEKAWAEVN